MPVPEITNEQRREYLRRAQEARVRVAGLKKRVACGELSFAQLLDMPEAERMPVADALKSFPGIGKKGAEQIMRRVGISPTRRIKGLGARQRAGLLEAIG